MTEVKPPVRWILISDLGKRVSGISTRTLRRWCEKGQIPASRRGSGRWWIDEAALMSRYQDLIDDRESGDE